MKIAYMLRDPLDLVFLFIYVIGVLVLIFAAMQFLHAVLYKDTKARRDGMRALLLGVVLLAPRIVYHQFRLDASDYKKAVTSAYQSGTDAILETGDGYTLIAVQQADTDPANADIVVLSTALYTPDGAPNAAGLAVLKAVSEQTLKKKSAVELRYIAFTGEEDALAGARNYLSSLPEEEKARVVADIQVGDIGHADAEFQIAVSNGRENPLTDRLVKSVKRMSGQKATMRADKSADHTAFSMEGIVSAALTQEGDAAPEMDELAKAAAVVGDTVQGLMRDKNSRFRTEVEATPVAVRAAGAFQLQVDAWPSGTGIPAIEQQLGTRLTDTGTSDADGCKIYTAQLYILQQDAPIPVEVHVTTAPERVDQITVDTSALGMDEAMLRPMLTNFFGEGSEKAAENGSHETIYLDSAAQAVYHVSATTTAETGAGVPAVGYTLSITAA
ncbi:MAG: M28 family peptidase [Lachnospiraceae bacterium]|nr:M28 family peptidase [Lachnospiraceae bacterium]